MANPTIDEKFFAYTNHVLTTNGSPTIDPVDYVPATPEVYTGSAYPRNTRIIFRPPLISPIVGPTVIYYDRINLALRADLSVSKGAATLLTELLPAINELLGINMQLGDVVQKTLPSSGPVDFTASASNKLFFGTTSIALTA